ncbi:MAG: heavy metal translocating P-type ATPase [Clostridiales bacterium]|nr:heavy metal translocating P-type ATPase [Clostridiales bacterium]
MEKYDVKGMSCAACSARVEKAVSNVDGVSSCAVNLLTNSMVVDGTASAEEIIKAVENAGYGASIHKDIDNTKKKTAFKDEQTIALLKRLISSLVFLLILMYFTMGHMMFSWPLPQFLLHSPISIAIIELVLTCIIMVINRHFFISGFKAIFHKAPNMDTLVAMGSAIGFLWSLYEFILIAIAQANGNLDEAHEFLMNLYFESSAMILTLITIGKTLESYSKGKTTNAIKGLLELAPDTANVIRDGKEITINVEDVVIGDIFIVRPGDSIPVDGIIIDGHSSINESSLTGESIPQDKTKDSEVFSGTINLTGFLKCKATRVGKDTTLSQIVKMVEDASATKAPIAKIADKVSGIFVPIILGIALITTIIWLFINKDVGYALARGISVLVISCPCALGLATPVAIMVGSGVGARNGILFKNAPAIEMAGKINIVALDKTGTITKGEMHVCDVISISNNDNNLIQIAYSVEKQSEHPLAQAIVRYAKSNSIAPLDIKDFEALSGSGVKAKVNGIDTYIGNVDLISQFVSIENDTLSKIDNLSKDGKTPILVAQSKLLGIIAIEDELKEDSIDAISKLKELGIKVYMLSGDNETTANSIAKHVGIDNVIANIKPNDKANIINSLKVEGNVCMVGDGINDAPALTSASLGVAIGAGSDIAIDSGDVVLVNSNLTSLVNAIKLGRKTLLNIKENLFWAFIYNLICIPIAAGALIPIGITLEPMYGAAAMSLSSFCVVMNALRLNLFKPVKQINNTVNNYSKGESTMDKTLKLTIEGMMCTHCEKHMSDALLALDGVKEIKVMDHTKNLAEIVVTKDIDYKTFEKAVQDAGYTLKGIQ